MIKKAIFIALEFAVAIAMAETKPLLQFTDGKFKVVLFTDLHYGEGPELDSKTDKVQESVLQQEKPDLIIYGGDMVSGWLGLNKLRWFQKRWMQLSAPAHTFSTPYATILGNHDDEADLNRRQILDLDIQTGRGLSYTRQGPFLVGGASNYYLDIYPPRDLQISSSPSPTGYFNGSAAVPAARLWFFDSMNRDCLGISKGWGCVAPTAIQWASSLASSLPSVPISMLFLHIPLPETMIAWSETTPALQQNTTLVGNKGEQCNCPSINTGLFKFAKMHGIQMILSGHDHSNDYEGVVDGIRIGYGRKSGYGSYGVLKQGARVVELQIGQQARQAHSWIALESGEREYQKPARVELTQARETRAARFGASSQLQLAAQQECRPGR